MKPLALWAIGPIAVLLLAGPSIFEFVFGSSWREAGVIARIIALLVGSRFVTVPVTQNLNILERQDLSLLWNSFRLVISAGAIVAAGLLGLGHRAGILSYAVAMSFAYLALIGVNYHAIRAVKTADDFVESRATDHALQLDLTDNEP
jgi:O-antigen/teichoic acid export membrane protein